MRCATFLGVLVGCATPSEPLLIGDPPIKVSSGPPVRVSGPDYEMEFSPTGVYLPSSLLVGASRVEALGSSDECGLDHAGIAILPALAISASTRSFAARSEIATPLTGPAVARVHVTFEVDYMCPGLETAAGAVDFTFFPSGRIVRHDLEIRPSTNRLGLVGNCGCQHVTNPSDFQPLYFWSYWAFTKDEARKQVRRDGSEVTSADSNVPESCTMYAARSVGVRWTPLSEDTNVVLDGSDTADHFFEWPTDPNREHLDPTPQSVSSAIQLSNRPWSAPSDCAGVLDALAMPPLATGDELLASTDPDGIYRDPARHTSAFTIKPLSDSIPAGFAVSVDLGGASHATLTRSPDAERVGIVQREAGDRFLIVFDAGLAPSESVTIDPSF